MTDNANLFDDRRVAAKLSPLRFNKNLFLLACLCCWVAANVFAQPKPINQRVRAKNKVSIKPPTRRVEIKGVRWEIELDDQAWAEAVAPDKIFLGTQSGTVYAINRASGARVWSAAGLKRIDDLKLIKNSVVVSANGNLIVFDQANGSVKWKLTVADNGFGRFEVQNDTVFFANSEAVAALDLNDGKEKWRSTECGAPETGIFDKDQTLFIGCADGRLLAFDKTGGAIKWKWGTRGEFGGLTVAADKLVVSYKDGFSKSFLIGIEASDGAEKWRVATDDNLWMQLHNDSIIVKPFNEDVVTAYAVADARQLWSFDLSPKNAATEYDPLDFSNHIKVKNSRGQLVWAENRLQFPEYANDKVYLAKADGAFYVLSASDGKILGQHNLLKNANVAEIALDNSPQIVGDAALLLLDDGSILNFDPATWRLRWKFHHRDSSKHPVSVSENTLYYPSHDKFYNAVDLSAAPQPTRTIAARRIVAATKIGRSQTFDVYDADAAEGLTVFSTVAVSENIGYLTGSSTKKGALYQIDLRTGTKTLLCKVATGRLTAPVVRRNTLVFASTEPDFEQRIYAFDLSAKTIVWSARLDKPLFEFVANNSQLLADDEYVYVPNQDLELTAYRISTGAVTRAKQFLPNYPSGHPILRGSVFYAASAGNLLALKLLEANREKPFALEWSKFFGKRVFKPAANDNAVFAATEDGIIRAFDRTSGAEIWSFATEADASYKPFATEKYAVFRSGSATYTTAHVFDAATGKEAWRGKPVNVFVHGDTVYYQNETGGALIAADLKSGAIVKRFANAAGYFPFAAAGANVLLGQKDNKFAAFDAQTDRILWETDFGARLDEK